MPSADLVDLSVVIVSYHCRDQVLACVKSVADSVSTMRTEVIVVDNGSTDGTIEALQAEAPQVTLVPMGITNTGFLKGHERRYRPGAPPARPHLEPRHESGARTGARTLSSNWLDAHPGAGAVAPRLLNRDGTDQRTARSFPTPSAAIFGRRSPLTRWFPQNRWSRSYLAVRANAGERPFRVDLGSPGRR